MLEAVIVVLLLMNLVLRRQRDYWRQKFLDSYLRGGA